MRLLKTLKYTLNGKSTVLPLPKESNVFAQLVTASFYTPIIDKTNLEEVPVIFVHDDRAQNVATVKSDGTNLTVEQNIYPLEGACVLMVWANENYTKTGEYNNLVIDLTTVTSVRLSNGSKVNVTVSAEGNGKCSITSRDYTPPSSSVVITTFFIGDTAYFINGLGATSHQVTDEEGHVLSYDYFSVETNRFTQVFNA